MCHVTDTPSTPLKQGATAAGHTFSPVTNNLMQTGTSSPLQAPEASGKAQWSKADSITLIEYITEHKAEAGDGMKFKALFWSGAAKEMVSHHAFGGMKTLQGCSSKWDQVHTKLSQTILLLTHIYPAQEVIQCCCYAQSQYIWIQLESDQGAQHHD
jgi:hypothetical protein